MTIQYDIIQSLKSLPCFTEIIELSQLSDGYSHTCLKVSTYNHIYFAKKLNNATANGEVNAAMACAERGISPAIIYHDKQWLVTEFVDATSLADAKINADSKTIIALKLLADCNTLVAPEYYQSIPLLNARQSVNALLTRPTSLIAPHLDVLDKVTHTLTVAIESLICKTQPLNVLCHGDVNFTNVILGKNQRSWLIDFECAHRAPVEFDLAMFIAVNDISIIEVKAVIDAYSELVPSVNIDLELLHHYLLYSFYINGLWYLDNNLQSLAITQWSAFDNFSCLQSISFTKLMPLIT